MRIAGRIWDPAEARAKREGRGPLVNVVREFLEEFGRTEEAEPDTDLTPPPR